MRRHIFLSVLLWQVPVKVREAEVLTALARRPLIQWHHMQQ